MTKQLSIVFGAVFVLVGMLGFVDNPVIGPAGIFETNQAHNMAHLLIGAVMLIAGFASERAAFLSLTIFGAVYLLLAIMGFAAIGTEGSTMLLGMVHVNGADNWLHVVLAVVLLAAGLARRRVSTVRTAH